MKTQQLEIGGMSCGHCVMALRKELEKIPGLTVTDVQVGKAEVAYDEALVSPAAITAAITEAGYVQLS